MADCTTGYYDGLQKYCYFVVGVRGAAIGNRNSFVLEAAFDSTHMTSIKENSPFMDRIQKGQYRFYSFSISNQEDLEYVDFRVSSSLVQMYISTEEDCNNPTEVCAKIKGNSMKPVRISYS